MNILLVFWITGAPAAFSQPTYSGTRLFVKNKINPLKAEESDRYDSIFNGRYWKGYLADLNRIVAAPGLWKGSEWITTAAGSSIILGIYLADEDIQEIFQKNRNKTTDEISKVAFNFGETIVIVPGIILFYLYGNLNNDIRIRRTALLSLESFIIANLFTQTLKYAGRRHRPNSGDPSTTWDGPGSSSSPSGGDPDGLSFPSGHTASSFAIASIIASEYDDNIVVGALVYGASILTALSRINDNKHWASDVFGGAAIGYFTGKAILSFHKNPGQKGLKILPAADSTHIGLMINYRF